MSDDFRERVPTFTEMLKGEGQMWKDVFTGPLGPNEGLGTKVQEALFAAALPLMWPGAALADRFQNGPHSGDSEVPKAANGQINFSDHPVQGLDAKPSLTVAHQK